MEHKVGLYPSTCQLANANSRHVKPIFPPTVSRFICGREPANNNMTVSVDTCARYATSLIETSVIVFDGLRYVIELLVFSCASSVELD